MLTFKSLRRFLLAAVFSSAALGPAAASATPTAPVPALLGTQQLQGQLNLNTASPQQLTLLPGVGPATAAKIVAYRDRHLFRRLSHLMRIKGIGKKTFARVRPYLTLEGETTLQVVPRSPLPPGRSP